MTHDELLKAIHYDPETGFFTKREASSKKAAGERLGGPEPKTGYRRIRLLGKLYREHRLAWFYMHGTWPTHGIDHKNRIKSDTRFDNLRAATSPENSQNIWQSGRPNTSGLPGVKWMPERGKWRAFISINGRYKHIGLYATAEAASAAYETFKAAAHPFSNPDQRSVKAS